MKTNKFKIFDRENKKWLNVLRILLATDGEFQSVETLDGEAYGFHQVEMVQFTGLYDKNGKEIFEGDIVKNQFHGEKHISEVIFSTNGFLVGVMTTVKTGKETEWKSVADVEVIGNKFENEYLLK